MKKVLLVVIFGCFLSTNYSYANDRCNYEKLSDVKAILKSAEADYYPDNVSIKKVGEVNGKEIILFVTELIWGNHRSTIRLVLLSARNKYLGNYSIEFYPKQVKDNIVIFDIDPTEGNTINFSNGIPEKIFINGEIYSFEPGGK